MIQYPDEKSNNPYASHVQPLVMAPQQQQNQYWEEPLNPPPAYTQESPDTMRDDTYQGYNPQPQTYQAPLGSTSQVPPGDHQGDQAPSAGHYDQHPAYREPNNNLSPYSQNLGTVPQNRASSPNEESKLSLGSFFGNTGPPPMWHRQPPQHLSHDQFPSMCLTSNGTDLSKGFPALLPPCQLYIHPFATHDVLEEDWQRFLTDIKKAGSLSGGQRIISNAIPLIAGAGLVGGLLLGRAIEKLMKTKNRSAAGDIVDNWNYVILLWTSQNGSRSMPRVERLSGREGAAPLGDYIQPKTANGLRRQASSSSSSSSSSSDSEDDRRHGHGPSASHKCDKKQRRAARREARAERRQEKRARKAERRQEERARKAEREQEKRARKAERRSGKARREHSEPYQLFIQPIE
ncbi:hypothetical protein BDR07DRAFT_1477400 [Suillus spraguei]|nr:hypothetical protein BDR07DRAFT_1477400 [Suillus spraguei]